MVILKKKYFLIIQSIKDINLNKIRRNHKFFIIYRNFKKTENLVDLIKFRNKCRIKGFKFFVANDHNLNILLKSDGIYLSSFNDTLKQKKFESQGKMIIGSAHTLKEINQKIKQGCKYIIVSKLFKVDYAPKERSFGILKFNNLTMIKNKIVPLGGIKITNLNSLKNIKSDGFAIMSELKKKPAITSRLF